MLVRIDKFLSNNGAGSRSEVKELIKKGRVTIEGYEGAVLPTTKFDTDSCSVYVDERLIGGSGNTYIVLNKPAGVITATRDNEHKTVIDLLKGSEFEGLKDLSPVGRLDKDTEGLLIITDDGKLNHELTSPKHHAPKKYYVKVTGRLLDNLTEVFKAGFDIGDEKITRPAVLEILDTSEDFSFANITITEGRYHQVKRMFLKQGHEVVYLKRLSIGGFMLPEDLNTGEFRKMTTEEIESLGAAL